MIPKPSIRHRSPPQRIRTSGFQSTCRCSAGRFHVDGERQRSIRFSFVTPFRARADEEPRAPGRSPVIVYDEPPGENAPREDRHVEERADRTHCCDVRGGPDAGAGPPGRRRSRTWRAGRVSDGAAVRVFQADAAAHRDCDEDCEKRSRRRRKGVLHTDGTSAPSAGETSGGLAPEPDRLLEPIRMFENLYYLGFSDVGAPFQRATASSSSMRLTTPTKVGTYWWVD